MRILSLILASVLFSLGQNYSVKIAKLKYGGGGDWYSNPTSLPNLLQFVRKNTSLNIAPEEDIVEPDSPEIFDYPLIYLTGHGNILFTPYEVKNIRKYLLSGGFLFMDDNYGLHKYALREMKKVFPEIKPIVLSAAHPIFHQLYDFPKGLPKIHEHDGKPAQLFAWFYKGRLTAILTYEADLGDGWEDPIVHNDPEPLRQKALKMGCNILLYVFTN